MTAVEFAVEKLSKFIPSGNQLVIHIILEQAKELEKQQIIDAIAESNKSNNRNVSLNPDQYYKETFNKQ